VLQGALACPTLESDAVAQAEKIGTSMRIPADLLKRADRLVPLLAAVPTVAAMGQVTRAKVLGLALAHGLAVLEAEYAKGKPKGK
jgi:hypothetical protein